MSDPDMLDLLRAGDLNLSIADSQKDGVRYVLLTAKHKESVLVTRLIHPNTARTAYRFEECVKEVIRALVVASGMAKEDDEGDCEC